MNTKKRREEQFEKEFSPGMAAPADDESPGDDVLRQDTPEGSTSGNPLSKPEAEQSEQPKDQSEELDALVQTALMETYN